MGFFSSRKKILFLSLTAALLAGALALLWYLDGDRQFTRLADRIFRSEMTSNTLSMHYTLASPGDFGITDYTPALPCYISQEKETSLLSLQQDLQQLKRISEKSLTESNRITCELLTQHLELTLQASSFPYYEEPLSPNSGMQSQLPILLAEYTFRTVADVEDYLALLDQTDEYFASLSLYEKEKKAAGLLQADTSLTKVQEQCLSILSRKELEADRHFLQTTFKERITPLVGKGLLTPDQALAYTSENDRLLTTVVQPAYEALADDLFLLMEDGTSRPRGLASLPQGKEYYTLLLKSITGSSKTPEEIKSLLYPAFDTTYHALRDLLLSNSDALEIWETNLTGAAFPYPTPEEMLADLQHRMEETFPALPDTSSPQVNIKQVTSSLADYCAPAFYLTPPFDDTSDNVIYINPASTSAGLELYTTLAHEGYPGHLYQTVYNCQKHLATGTHPIRQLLWYGGYQEGWALYVEFLAYDYAIALAREHHLEEAALAWEIEKHNRSMQLCLYSLLDISIHYDNVSYEQAARTLSQFGITSPEIARHIYDYIAEEPATYLKYYLGYLEILALREQARSLWQSSYSDLRFHSFLLDFGPADFQTLEMGLTE